MPAWQPMGGAGEGAGGAGVGVPVRSEGGATPVPLAGVNMVLTAWPAAPLAVPHAASPAASSATVDANGTAGVL